jgi:intracellular sulfur oxidation DsrE/DsrF family protein
MQFTNPRRLASSLPFVLAFVAAVASAGIATFVATAHATDSTAAPAAPVAHEAWLDALKGKHRALFDAPAPGGGIPLVHLMNYYDTYNKAYATKDQDINGILTFYGGTTFYGLTDEMWAKYRLGEFLDAKDPATERPATANPWRVAPVVLGMTLAPASIEAMQKRGATFIICNNALSIFSGLLAKERGLHADSVYADLKANILPKVTLVPGMVVAIEKAQARGIAYHRQ